MSDEENREPYEDARVRSLTRENMLLREHCDKLQEALRLMTRAYEGMADAYSQQKSVFDKAYPILQSEVVSPTQLLIKNIISNEEDYRKYVHSNNDDKPTCQRRSMMRALYAVSDYLEARRPLISEMLDVLRYALNDVEEGRKHPLFMPPPTQKGVQRTLLRTDLNMARLAAAVTLLIQSGMTEEEALRKCTRCRPDLSAKQLGRWRDHLNDRPIRTRDHYSHCVKKKKEQAEMLRSQGSLGSADDIERRAAREAAAMILKIVKQTLE